MPTSTRSSGGRLAGNLFPRVALAATGAPLLLWLLATYGALKPSVVVVHNHAAPSDRPARPPARREVPPPADIVISTPPPQIFISGSSDPERTGKVVQAELESRQRMVTAAKEQLARELRGETTGDDLLEAYHQGLNRIYPKRKVIKTSHTVPAVAVPAAGAPTNGWFISDCEDNPQVRPIF